MKSQYHRLMLVTNSSETLCDDYLKFIELCARSGITALQLRHKTASYESLFQFGLMLKKVLSPYRIPLIVNDNVNLAIELDADGVHLGQADGSPQKARDLLGSEKIIGVTIDSINDLHDANLLPINYVGVGAIFPTQNKPDVKTIWGIDGLSKLSMISEHNIVAIGGINESNIRDVMLAGAKGVAVIGAIHNTINPSLTIKRFKKIIGEVYV